MNSSLRPAGSADFASRLGMLRLPLIVCVIFLHAYRPGGSGAAPGGWMHTLDLFVSDHLVMLARPIFFMIAGFFFFSGGELTRAVLLRKWSSRVHTLLVPYVLWNLLILCLWALAQWLPATSGILPAAGKRVADFGAWDYVNAILGMSGYPIAYQLWFIRDLMLLMLMAPLFQLASKRAPNFVSLVLLLAWLTETWPLGIPAAEGVVFFYAGVRLALSPGAPERLDRWAWPILLLYAGYLIAFAWLPARMSAHAWGMIGLALGGAAVIFLTRALVRHERIRRSLACPAGLVFFLFAAHEPLLTVVKKGAYHMIGEASPGAILLCRLGVTLLVAALCAAGYRIMERLAPRLLRVLTGNR